MGGDVEVHDAPPVVCQYQEDIEDMETNRRHGEEVYRYYDFDVTLEKGPPGLRRGLPSTYHVFAHAGLADVDTELEQFAVDARPAP
jgi:hypothetical protein